MIKICSCCKEEKGIDKFYKDKSKKSGAHHRCIECDKKREKLRDRRTSKTKTIIKSDKQDHKICIKCGEEKHIDLFQRDYTRPMGRINICLVCRNLERKYYNADESLKSLSKQEIVQYRIFQSMIGEVKKALKGCEFKAPQWTINGVYVCNICKEEKPLNSFYKYKGTASGYDTKCKECSNKQSVFKTRKYRATEQGKIKTKEYRKTEQWILNARVGRSKRRALAKEVNQKFNAKDAREVLNRFNHSCFKCGSKTNLHIDHHVPLSKGGRLTFTNAVILCAVCNVRKSNHNPEEFYSHKELSLLNNKFGVHRDSLFN